MKTNKDLYRKFCKENTDIPIFLQPFWLDIASADWDVIICSENTIDHEKYSKIIAALPYCIKGNFVTKRIFLPEINFYQSILFIQNISKEEQQKIAIKLFQQLPFVIKSYFKFQPAYQKIKLNTLGFKDEIYSTYILQKKASYQLSKHHQRHIQKGVKSSYQIGNSTNIPLSYQLIADTFFRKNIKPKLSFNTFQQIDSILKKYHCGKILNCLDSDKNLLATLLFVEDNGSIYYLFSGYNINYKNSGAVTFLLHHIIQEALEKGKIFNFCGSQNKNIATYFEGFGAQPIEIPIWKKGIYLIP